jgi:hypothetical protein
MNILMILIMLHLIGQQGGDGMYKTILEQANCIYVMEMRLY